MKNKQAQTHDAGRREFLHGAAAAGVGAAVVASFPGAVAAAPEQPQVSAEVTRDKGYQETGHVRKYYETLSS